MFDLGAYQRKARLPDLWQAVNYDEFAKVLASVMIGYALWLTLLILLREAL